LRIGREGDTVHARFATLSEFERQARRTGRIRRGG
jgi:hypothetical protein